ncbi:MAG: transposase [Bacteriovoracaceae bacterium]|nr:transposase [Bacteriovoracaceae bacterium]
MPFADIKNFTIELFSKLPVKMLVGAIKTLLNKVDAQENKITELSSENQKLKDEINRLKGEKGKPDIAKNKDDKKDSDDKKKGGKNGGRGKNKNAKEIEIHNTEEKDVEKKDLPKDAQYKGTRDVVIQDINFNLNNTKFIIHKYYSPFLGKVFEGQLPPEYKGSIFGPGIWSFVIQFHYEARMTQNLLFKILTGLKVKISVGEISNMILCHERFEEERQNVREAGISRSDFSQIDDTGARLNGKNGYSIAVCNQFFTDYYTSLSKNREAVLRALAGTELKFAINEIALKYVDDKVNNKAIVGELRKLQSNRLYGPDEFTNEILNAPWARGKITSWIKHIKEGCAIGAFRDNFLGVRSKILICDDAPQFKGILEFLGLCLIHEERHYKKLTPSHPDFIKAVADFRETFWKYYEKLKLYKINPNDKKKKELSDEFDLIFLGKTCYFALNQLMEKTRAKKDELLLVLEFPTIPLHNNTSELAMREKVIQRKIRGYFRSLEGAMASDIFLGLMSTCRKIGISFGEYLKDRFYNRHELPPLGDLIWMA